MRNISLFALVLFFTYLYTYCHVEAIGIGSASHGLLYGGRVVRRYEDFNRYPMPRGILQERPVRENKVVQTVQNAQNTPKNIPNTSNTLPNVTDVQKTKEAAAPPQKNQNEKNEADSKDPKALKDPKPPKPSNTSSSSTQGHTGDDSGDSENDDSSKDAGTPKVAVGGVSKNAVAGLCAVGGVFVLVAGLFAFSQRRKNKEVTKSKISTSAKAWEQQSSTFEKMEEATEPIGSYTVIATYMPTLADELDIQPGDKVTILVEYDDGWVQGINETRGGAKGVFPRHCVDMGTTSSKNDKRSSSMGGYTEVDLS